MQCSTVLGALPVSPLPCIYCSVLGEKLAEHGLHQLAQVVLYSFLLPLREKPEEMCKRKKRHGRHGCQGMRNNTCFPRAMPYHMHGNGNWQARPRGPAPIQSLPELKHAVGTVQSFRARTKPSTTKPKATRALLPLVVHSSFTPLRPIDPHTSAAPRTSERQTKAGQARARVQSKRCPFF